ncbi:MAG: prepilin-type N-terminal cleavage/methylation domain-containing protein [Chloroflexi bacterium]|nr:prepilin-type N-terminal cleavage/methylation domain-containing protein [Chloroflexota bacterium]MCI0800811.1 prepilin-type N-terminal cleavage/methylation domain-containing protein [Chloroflexota bacterium]
MKPVRHILGSSGGFTLIELLVSITILTVVVGIFGAGMFQVLSIQRFWTDDVKAVREVRHAGSWFSGDALNATDVLDAGGVTRLTCAPNPSVQQITMTWTDASGTPHNVVYSVTGDELQRDFDSNGTPLIMASRVVANSISFTLCGNTLRLNVDVLADRDTTDKLDLITYVRKLS